MKIICVQHHPQTGNKSFVLKPDSALLLKGNPFFYPDFSNEIDCELNVVIKINRLGKSIQAKFAHKYYSEVALGLNFVAKDIQRQAIADAIPHTLAVGFDDSAALSDFVPLDKLLDKENIVLQLAHNSAVASCTINTQTLIQDINHTIETLSHYMTLKIGDYIYTPAPISNPTIAINDCIEGIINDMPLLKCRIK